MMQRFFGRYSYSLDDKGRINVPAKFRKSTDKDITYFITYKEDQCLYIYPSDVYEKAKISFFNKLSEMDEDHQTFLSLEGEKTVNSNMDKQGRISIPIDFLEKVGIKKEVMIIGAINKIEVWAPETREQFRQQFSNSGADLKKKIYRDLNNEKK